MVQPGVDTLTLVDNVVDSTGAVVDISAATSIDVILEAPDGTQYTATGSFRTDGTDGIAEAAFANKINQAGTWFFQFDYAGISPGNRHSFEVAENLENVTAP